MALIYPGKPGQPASDWKPYNYENNCNKSTIKCNGNNFKLNSSDPAYQYQTQKIIQNTVRVPSSLYTSDLGALNIYQSPTLKIGVNWNQMSDRAKPHFQTNSGNSQGSFYHGSSTRHTQTRARPGAGTPGGVGVDIKHNSYYRYMGRLKAKKDIRRGVIPPTFGLPIPFNPAFPIYGGKTVKTSIVSGCDCPDVHSKTLQDNSLIYKAYIEPEMFNSDIVVYPIGSYVYARYQNTINGLKAKIIAYNPSNNIYTVQFTHDSSVENIQGSQLIPYFSCSLCKSESHCTCNDTHYACYSDNDDNSYNTDNSIYNTDDSIYNTDNNNNADNIYCTNCTNYMDYDEYDDYDD